MKPIDLKLRCFAQQEKDKSWFAVCIDLNLLAQGDSVEEARKKLHLMIADYLTEALTIDEKYIDDLIPRKAPFFFLLNYHWLTLKNKLHAVANHATSQLFTEHLPLMPVSHGR